MNIQFSSRSWAEYLDVKAVDAKLFDKINTLTEECRRHPFNGMGKPEPLGGNLSGWWFRRISQEHRLVYLVSGIDGEQIVKMAQFRCYY